MTEVWLPVIDYETLYCVSNKGRVRSEDRMIKQNDGTLRKWAGRILKPSTPKPGKRAKRYPSVGLWRDGVQKTHRVHNLVAAVFLGPRPDGASVLHWDDNPLNAAATNLRYGTSEENGEDARRNHPTCRSGHLKTKENTYTRPDTGRPTCLPCRVIQNNKRYNKISA